MSKFIKENVLKTVIWQDRLDGGIEEIIIK